MSFYKDLTGFVRLLTTEIEAFLERGRPTVFLPHRSQQLRNSGICFLKPELCLAGPEICQLALEEFCRRSHTASIAVTGLYGFAGHDLIAYGILDLIYHDIARNAALDFCSSTAPARFEKIARVAFGHAVPVCGSLTLASSGISSATLLRLWQSADWVYRIEPDCYAAPVTLDGQEILLINGFFSYHMEQYAEENARILLAFIETDQSFESLKSTFQGDADPDRRKPGTFRDFLSDLTARSGCSALTISLNGVHMSGSTAEGRHEAAAFLSHILECGL